MTDDDRVGRLRERVERERRARRQAEIIAERGMRELWEANSRLQQRVSERTVELEDRVRSAGYAEWARWQEVSAAVAALASSLRPILAGTPEPISAAGRREGQRRLDDVVRAIEVSSHRAPDATVSTQRLVAVADQILDRWQRAAAGSGRLLTVDAGRRDAEPTTDWAAVHAAVDLIIEDIVRRSAPGGLEVGLTASADHVVVTLTDRPRPPADPPDPVGGVGTARSIAERVGGRVTMALDAGRLEVEIVVPASG